MRLIDLSTILREIERNKKFTTANNWNIGKRFENPSYLRKCEKLNKSPYVCNGCKSRSGCRKEKIQKKEELEKKEKFLKKENI